MRTNMPKTPFSTRLSGSAREMELRLRNIFQWKKKRPPVIAFVVAFLVIALCGSLVGFSATPEEPRKEEPVTPENSGQAEEEKAQGDVAHYFGALNVESEDYPQRVYDIRMIQDIGGEQTQDGLRVTMEAADGEKVLQELTYNLRHDFRAETLEYEPQIEDINADSSDDLVIDIGIYGHTRLFVCYLYDNAQEQYVFLEGFDELNWPLYLPEQNAFRVAHWPMTLPLGYDRYEVQGNELVMTATLTYTESEQFGPIYTERRLIDGEWKIVKHGVSEDKIDLAAWGLETTSPT